ncbi:MAG: hypothetical protein A3G80_06270 [Betaproteobacteria bacterium RIFCSPLOWO2_12_FULL_62_13b]|nr:MAG: hypothetical protein A3G80_06270 [Betaproteobacteria bacterium RIFCSPLOWO2_12_FULL_62_13b]
MVPEFSNATIVLLGTFDPNAFVPDALAQGKVISKKEAERVKFETLVRGHIVHFRLSWGELLVGPNHFQIGTTGAPYVRICDFATKALNDLPTKSVVTAFGINLECHFNLGSIKSRDALGRKLAPPKAWGGWGETILENMHGNQKENPKHGGMFLLQMRQPFVEKEISGWLDVWAGPSTRIADNMGVFFRTTHHHQLTPQAKEGHEPGQQRKLPIESRPLLEFLVERFDASILSAENIFEGALAN